MRRCLIKSRAALLFVILAVALLALSPTPALAHNGGCHRWAAQAATELAGVGPNHPIADPMDIDRDRPFPLLPELGVASLWYNTKFGCCDDEDLVTQPNFDFVRWGSQHMDDIEGDTRHHFWFPEEGMHECPNDVAGINNAWESIHEHWVGAIDAWQAGNLGQAYAELGYAMHFVQDGGQPALANEDMHPGDTWSLCVFA